MHASERTFEKVDDGYDLRKLGNGGSGNGVARGTRVVGTISEHLRRRYNAGGILALLHLLAFILTMGVCMLLFLQFFSFRAVSPPIGKLIISGF
jgi:hypothetical protein